MQRDNTDDAGVRNPDNHGFETERVRELEEENERMHRELEQLNLLIDALPAPVAYIDPEHQFRLSNKACRMLFSGLGEDLEGAELARAIGPERYRELGPFLARAFRGEDIEIDSRIDLLPGSPRVIRMTLRPDRDTDGSVRGVVMHLLDVTAATGRADDGVSETELRLARIADANILGIGFWKGERIVEGNDMLLQMLGFSRDELMDGVITLETITPGAFHGAIATAREQMLAGGFAHPYEKDLVRRDGSHLPVLFGMGLYEGRTDQGAFFALDITDKRQMESALRNSEERYRAWVENSSEGIWRFELDEPVSTSASIEDQLDQFYEHGHLAECNGAMARMYGLESPEQIIGARLGDFLLRSDPANEEYLRGFVLSGYRLIDAESHERDSQGNLKFFLNNLVGVIDNGMLRRAWGTQRDITERKRVESEVMEAREAAEAASRAKDRFLATLSHELRTPLTPVVAAIDLLRSEEDLPETIEMAIDIIARNVDLEARLIDDLLDLTRISNGKLELRTETLELTPLVERVIEICHQDIEQRKLHLDLALDADLHRVEGDASRLQQVFWNLLKNAIKFTPVGGRIWIGSRVTDGGIQVEIGDSGIGIEPALLHRIFDPFEQGKSEITQRFGGLGLGLAISRTIVTMHGGSLSAQSAGPGHGSVFTVTLDEKRDGTTLMEHRT